MANVIHMFMHFITVTPCACSTADFTTVNFSAVQKNNRRIMELEGETDYRDEIVVLGMRNTCYGYNVVQMATPEWERAACWNNNLTADENCPNGESVYFEAQRNCSRAGIDPWHCNAEFTPCMGVKTVRLISDQSTSWFHPDPAQALEATLKLHPEIEYIVFESTQLGAFANNASGTFKMPVVDAITAQRIALRGFRGGNADTVWNPDGSISKI